MAVKEEKMITAGQNASGLMMPYGGGGGGHGMSPVKYGLYSPGLSNDPLLSGSTPRGKVRQARWSIQSRFWFHSTYIIVCVSGTKMDLCTW